LLIFILYLAGGRCCPGFCRVSEPLSSHCEATGRTIIVRGVPQLQHQSKRLWKLFHLQRSKPDLKPFIRILRRKKTAVSVSSAEVLSFDDSGTFDLKPVLFYFLF
tara:strand:- start:68120 stop:68434 length:315 start_codon:yes stop_codon:yes gene_type:complete